MKLIPGYELTLGSERDRLLLLTFMQLTYEELHPGQPTHHLATTVNQYFSWETPVWWVHPSPPKPLPNPTPIACLWIGNAVDQSDGERHATIFLLYVTPLHRRQGIGSALMGYAETWAEQRGDRQIALQVFQSNQPALTLYQKLGYTTQSLWMVKPLT